MGFGVDFSQARPTIDSLKANGVTFVIRYLYPGGGKGLTSAEYAQYKAAGISVGVVFEGASGGMLNGRTQGVTDAQLAVSQIASVGLPVSIPVYFACDFDAASAQMGAIDEYLEGAASVISPARVGLYGGLAVIQHVQASKTASWFWQTYAWSGGKWAGGTHLQQYLNGQWSGTVDFCRNLNPNFGQDTAAGTSSTLTDQILGGLELPKIISVPAGTIALVTELSGTKYTADSGAQLFSIQANETAYGQVTGLTEDQVTTLVNEANARGAALAAQLTATPMLSAADIASLAAQLKAALPAGITEADVQTAMKAVFTAAGK